MAHHREKLGLGAIGSFGLIMRSPCILERGQGRGEAPRRFIGMLLGHHEG